MKKPDEILEAYDLTGSLRGAAALAGGDHKTVARLVAAREAAGGGLLVRTRGRPLVDPFAETIDELVDRSRARVRADVVHGVLVAMEYGGRTGRRGGRSRRRSVAGGGGTGGGRGRGSRSRGLGYAGIGDGPVVAGRRAVLFCAWLARSRFRVVVPLLGKTLPSVVIGLDRTLRQVGGVRT